MSKTCQSKTTRYDERGNALIYVLIAVALFAALNFVLSDQTDSEEMAFLNGDKAEIVASQIITYASQAKSAVDQMLFTGGQIDNLSFDTPLTDATAFNTSPHFNKVYHPSGGGLNIGNLPENSFDGALSDPNHGWYMGRFNNIEWTTSTDEDVILVAFGLTEQICGILNDKITGSTAIPQITDSIKEVMIDDDLYSSGTNTALTTAPGSPICGDCHERASLCVEDTAGDIFAFYTVIADQ